MRSAIPDRHHVRDGRRAAAAAAIASGDTPRIRHGASGDRRREQHARTREQFRPSAARCRRRIARRRPRHRRHRFGQKPSQPSRHPWAGLRAAFPCSVHPPPRWRVAQPCRARHSPQHRQSQSAAALQLPCPLFLADTPAVTAGAAPTSPRKASLLQAHLGSAPPCPHQLHLRVSSRQLAAVGRNLGTRILSAQRAAAAEGFASPVSAARDPHEQQTRRACAGRAAVAGARLLW